MNVNWTLEIGGTDFTSRVTGLDVRQRCGIAELGTMTASVQLLNNDGALTPRIGGTYSNVDWGSQLVELYADTTGVGNVLVFFGFMSDFALDDDGTNSVFAFTALDPFSAMGRAIEDDTSLTANPPAQPLDLAVENLLNNGTGAKTITGVPAPIPAGATSAAWRVDDVTASGQQIYQKWRHTDPGYYEDIVRNRMLTPAMSLLIPKEWDSTAEEHVAVIVQDGLNRSDRVDVSFGGSNLEVEVVRTGHNLQELTNMAAIYYRGTNGDGQSQNTTSTDAYGPRSVDFTQVEPCYEAGGTSPSSGAVLDAELFTDEWVERFGTYRYQAREVTTRASLNASHAQAFENLLNIDSLWGTGTVTYTPTGAASAITDTIVIAGKRIRANASDTRISVELLPAADFQSFVLNNSTLGVLDTNRLG